MIDVSRLKRAILAAAMLSCLPGPGFAWSIWSNKPTDDSVCDLSPQTTYKLSARTFVEDGTKGELDIYARLAIREVVRNCVDGQVLILHSRAGSEFDDSYFKLVAGRLCNIATIAKTNSATVDNPNAFEVRCPIQKHDDAAKWSATIEAEKSTEAMIAEGAPKRTRPTRDTNAATKDCGKPTVASVIFGRGGHCQ